MDSQMSTKTTVWPWSDHCQDTSEAVATVRLCVTYELDSISFQPWLGMQLAHHGFAPLDTLPSPFTPYIPFYECYLSAGFTFF